MSFGLDYVAGPPVSDLKAAGVTFVCRYLSEVNDLTKVKLLTPEEAALLGENGIAVVSNFEWYGNRAAEGHASGVMDAQIADAQHKACGGPPGRPIYFSVDFNTSATAEIIDYFKGVASVIGLERTGAYGGYECIKGLLDAEVIRWAWQTYAWSGGVWEPRTHIQQYQNGAMLAGHEVDYDRSVKTDFGQWLHGGNMLQITDPSVGDFFEAIDDTHWRVKKNGCIIQDGNLALYRGVKSGQTPDLAGLTLFGLAQTNELPLDNKGNTIQHYERVSVRYDPGHVYDRPPGAGSSYVAWADQPDAQPSANVQTAIAALQALGTTVTTGMAQVLKDLGA